jgi:hypothetical protein
MDKSRAFGCEKNFGIRQFDWPDARGSSCNCLPFEGFFKLDHRMKLPLHSFVMIFVLLAEIKGQVFDSGTGQSPTAGSSQPARQQQSPIDSQERTSQIQPVLTPPAPPPSSGTGTPGSTIQQPVSPPAQPQAPISPSQPASNQPSTPPDSPPSAPGPAPGPASSSSPARGQQNAPVSNPSPSPSTSSPPSSSPPPPPPPSRSTEKPGGIYKNDVDRKSDTDAKSAGSPNSTSLFGPAVNPTVSYVILGVMIGTIIFCLVAVILTVRTFKSDTERTIKNNSDSRVSKMRHRWKEFWGYSQPLEHKLDIEEGDWFKNTMPMSATAENTVGKKKRKPNLRVNTNPQKRGWFR